MEKELSNVIYTIGHSRISLEEFLDLLKKYRINCIVDVRSTPYSQFASQFNKENLKFFLKNKNMKYLYMGKEFGARREEKTLYDEKGDLDFVKTAESKLFSEGVDRVAKGIEKGYEIAFMCAEKEPMDCHRAIMVGRKFSELGYDIIHILHDSTNISQKELEQRLLNKYFPNRDQVSIFTLLDKVSEDEGALICKAYKCRNSEIAYNVNAREEYDESLYNRVYAKNG